MPQVPTSTGRWVDENFARLSEVIKDYDASLDLRFIPPENRVTDFDRRNPYVVVESTTQGEQVVFHAGPMATPEEILQRLFLGDSKHGNVLDKLDAMDRANEALRMKREIDEAEERQDLVAFLVGTKKNYIHHNGKVLDDQLRQIR